MRTSVAIVDDDPAFAEGMKQLISRADGLLCVAVCPSAEDALNRLPALRPDVVLMDIELPKSSGIECVGQLKLILPQTEFMMVTVFGEAERIYRALSAGATGYLVKDREIALLPERIRDLRSGGSPMSAAIARKVVHAFRDWKPVKDMEKLSRREEEVLQLLAQGHLYKQVGAELKIDYNTVRTHVQNIYKKLHVHTRAQAVEKSRRSTKENRPHRKT